MLGIQLAALSVPELRRLLEAARARGQDSLVRQLEVELAARPGRTAGPTLPMSVMPRHAGRPDRRSTPRRRASAPNRGPAIAIAGLAAFIGAALAWGLSLAPLQAPAPRPQPVSLAAGEAPTRVAVALTTRLPEEDPDQPVEEPAAPALDDVAAPPRLAAAAAQHNPCYDLPTARERLVCGYPSLAIQERRMKAALERARAGGADPAALEQAQAEWMQASANISDRHALADRYARRVSELEGQ
ncbi:hypothetical protein [Phenylobacterium sp.]|uniref:hypothetical protein n=1 Tax=Phenylobacterium sp. TaxID=1871053 RepID=UPI0025F5A26E|nr:hypothetical protein [Phenylobacterium sp.]